MNKFQRIFAPLRALVRLHKLALGLLGGALLLYAVIGFVVVPRVALRQLDAYVSETLKRKITVGDLSFNPFTLAAELSDLRLVERDGSPMLGFGALRVDVGLWCSLWRRMICLQEVRLDSPSVALVIARDGTLNLAALAPPSEEPEPEQSGEPPRVRVIQLAVNDGRVALLDETRPRPFRAQLGPIEFSLRDFQTEVGHKNEYSFAAITPLGEALRWSGQFTVAPLGSTGDFEVRQLKLAPLDAYLESALPFVLASGELSLVGRYRVALDPLALDVKLPSLSLRNVGLAERADRGNEPLRLALLRLKDLAFSYPKQELQLKRVEIDGLRVEAIREADGGSNLERLFASSAPPSRGASAQSPQAGTARLPQASSSGGASPERPRSTKPMRVQVDTLSLSNAKIRAEDRGVLPAVKLDLAPIALTVRNFSSQPDAQIELETDVTINESGRLRAQGDVRLQPLEARISAKLEGLALPFLQPYVAQSSAMTLASGVLNVQGDVRYGPVAGGAAPLTASGDVVLVDLRTVDQFNNEDLVRWSSLALRGIRLGLAPDRLSVERVVVKKPYAKVLVAKDRSLNIQRVLDKDTAPAPPEEQKKEEEEEEDEAEGEAPKLAESAPAPVPFPVRIRRVEISDGAANFADQSVKPPFATAIVALNGSVVGLSSAPGSRAKVRLAGKVDRYAPVTIRGDVNLLAAQKYTDLSLNFQNMELTTFNPYSDKFAGYNISKGKLSTGLSYKVQDRKLDAQHHVIVDNLEFGTKTDSKEAAPIPVRLAVALLRDRHGIIDLELPVTGTLDDPKFRVGPLIWQVLLNVLTKAVTAPFTAIGKLFGGGEELAYVEFPSGSAELAPGESEKLTKLARALVERPQLKLDVPKTLASEADSRAIARRNYDSRVRAPTLGKTAGEADKARRLAALEASYRNIFQSAPAYPADSKSDKGVDLDARLAYLEQALLEKLKPDKAALDAIATQRARAVQQALLGNAELSPERVFITAHGDDSKAEKGKVRMEMKLE